jgi:hypothetical protein
LAARTNTRNFVYETDTGSNPLDPDTDRDTGRNPYGLADPNPITLAGCDASTCHRWNWTGIPQQTADAQEPDGETNELKCNPTLQF